MQALLPEGCRSLADAPADLVDAMAHASLIMSWQEHLPEPDQPPRWMWAVDDELDRWFEELRDRRGSPRSRRDDFDDESMTSNEFAIGRRS